MKYTVENDLLSTNRVLISIDDLPKVANGNQEQFPDNSIVIDCSLNNSIDYFTLLTEKLPNGKLYWVFNNADIVGDVEKMLPAIKHCFVTPIFVPEIVDTVENNLLLNLLSKLDSDSDFDIDVNKFVHLSTTAQISKSIVNILFFSYNEKNNLIVVSSQEECRLIDCLSFLVKKLCLSNHHKLDQIYAQSPMESKSFFIPKTNLFNTSTSSKDVLCYAVFSYRDYYHNHK